jgi:hypothetical protein
MGEEFSGVLKKVPGGRVGIYIVVQMVDRALGNTQGHTHEVNQPKEKHGVQEHETKEV